MTICVSDREVMEQDSEIVLSVERVSKKFCRDLKRSLFYGIQDITKELTGLRENSHKLRPHEFWAVNNVGFQLRRGEALGLVGTNGSGKTTLLRIISGLIKPDTGVVKVRGRVAPLIALGAGFNHILTGRENIYANMSVFGLSKAEIDERFDAVVEFAEIGHAIDAPVQTYSSGMAARLGFASAIHTQPDVLLIDEVLAVGDIKFRQKCLRKLSELRQNGVSFIFVSHNSESILTICDISIYLLKGKLIAYGNTNSVMIRYEQDLLLEGYEKQLGKMVLPKKDKNESLGLDIVYILFRDSGGQVIESPVTSEYAELCIGYKAYKEIDNIGIELTITEISREKGSVVVINSLIDKNALYIYYGEHEIQVEMPYICLRPGLYTVRVRVIKDSLYTLDFIESFKFTVEGKDAMGSSLFYQPREWHSHS
ncbi:MAG: ATP-binding cassette domain-containing protein [Hormoscilla sp. GM7CHS1pb]|nr:ATP-binding cassette domain-containing protein [Hormoscilla sp. GM7CHS1pb]